MTPDGNQSLERILEFAIVVSWADFMPGAQTGLTHIEYGLAAGRISAGQGLLQIPTPTQEEIVAAAASVSDALDSVGSAPAQLALVQILNAH